MARPKHVTWHAWPRWFSDGHREEPSGSAQDLYWGMLVQQVRPIDTSTFNIYSCFMWNTHFYVKHTRDSEVDDPQVRSWTVLHLVAAKQRCKQPLPPASRGVLGPVITGSGSTAFLALLVLRSPWEPHAGHPRGDATRLAAFTLHRGLRLPPLPTGCPSGPLTLLSLPLPGLPIPPPLSGGASGLWTWGPLGIYTQSLEISPVTALKPLNLDSSTKGSLHQLHLEVWGSLKGPCPRPKSPSLPAPAAHHRRPISGNTNSSFPLLPHQTSRSYTSSAFIPWASSSFRNLSGILLFPPE